MTCRKTVRNQLKTEFAALPENEGLARSMVCAFAAQCDPTVAELSDVRCAVSEAVTNAIVHGYQGQGIHHTVYIHATLYTNRQLRVIIRDKGCGIENVEQALQPLFTTDPSGERSGMGFSIMQSFMDQLRVVSTPGQGTTVMLKKTFASTPAQE